VDTLDEHGIFFSEVTRQVVLGRTTLTEDIHKYSDKVVQDIEKLKEQGKVNKIKNCE
jgi:hypothetical protein